MVDKAKTADLILALGGDQLLLGQHEKAIARFREAIRIDPTCGEAYAWLGKAYREMGRLDEAEKAFRDAIRVRPGFALAHFNLGLVYVARRDFDRALEQYELLRALHPVRAERLLEEINMLDDPEKSERSARPIVRDVKQGSGARPTEGSSESRRGRSARRLSPQLVETVADVFEPETPKASVSEPPREPSPSVPAGETEDVSEPPTLDVEPTAAPSPAAVDPQRAAPSPTPEVETWKRAAAADPRDAEAHWQLGRAYVAAGEYARASQAIELAIANRPDFAGSHPESIQQSVEMCLALGQCYERLGRFQDAVNTYEQALDIDPKSADVNLRLGLVLLVLNNRREAVERYRELARVAPDRAEPLLQRLLRLLAK